MKCSTDVGVLIWLLADLAVVQGKLVSAGGGSSICVWELLKPADQPGSKAGEAATGAAAEASSKQLRKVHPDLNVTMRSWLDRERVKGAFGGSYFGDGECQVDAGLTPSGLFLSAPPGPTGMNSSSFPTQGPPAAAGVGAVANSSSTTGVPGIIPPKMQCSAVWGMSPSIIPGPPTNTPLAKLPTITTTGAAEVGPGRGKSPGRAAALVGLPLSPKSKGSIQSGQLLPGTQQQSLQQHQQQRQQRGPVKAPLLWVRSLGLLAYPADHQLVLQDLKNHQQQWLSHHTQPIGATAVSQDEQLLATAAAAPEPGQGNWLGSTKTPTI